MWQPKTMRLAAGGGRRTVAVSEHRESSGEMNANVPRQWLAFGVATVVAGRATAVERVKSGLASDSRTECTGVRRNLQQLVGRVCTSSSRSRGGDPRQCMTGDGRPEEA